MKMENQKINGDPGVYCDACDEPCRSHFVKQCPQCGKYLCRNCIPRHSKCVTVSLEQVRRRMPRLVDFHLSSEKEWNAV